MFDIVPIISLPTFIPDLKSSLPDKSGFLSYISLIVEATDMLTSITAPNDAINIPANRRPPIFKLVLFATKINSSISDTL